MTAEVWGVVVTAINVVMTAYIARTVQKAGHNGVMMEQDRGVKDAWIKIDKVALGNPEDLDLLDGLIHPDKRDQDRLERRKRWLAYMVLNPLEAAWSAASAGNMDAGTLASSERTMRAMVQDDTVCELVDGFVYGNKFKERCKVLREEWLATVAGQESVRPPSTCSSSPVQ